MNASNPMTPGVYTVEKSAFPPGAAQVPTAMPAFIGYTEKATKNGKSLTGTPLLINSLSDFVNYFGGPPTYKFPINNVNSAKPDSGGPPPANAYDFQMGANFFQIGAPKEGFFYLYNCIRLFYLNGGGPAYIVSVGGYTAASKDAKGNIVTGPAKADRDQLLGGLELLKYIQFPKPTLILIPDALTLAKDDHTTVQQEMIGQAGDLIDRVAMLEVYNGDQGLDSPVISDFRNSVGVSFLSYACAYYPWLQTSVVPSIEIDFANLYRPSASDPTTITDITTLFPGNPFIGKLVPLSEDLSSLATNIMVPPAIALSGGTAIQYPDWTSAFNASPASTAAGLLADKGAVMAKMYQVIFDLGTLGASSDTPALKVNAKDLKDAIASRKNPNGPLATAMYNLAGIEKGLAAKDTPIGSKLAAWGVVKPVTGPTYPSGTTAETMYSTLEPLYISTFYLLLKALGNCTKAASTLVNQYNSALYNSNGDYANVMQSVCKKVNVLPPASAMAGIYTLIDNAFGVWRAPANINLTAVTEPMVSINDEQQASLNVDALGGKSINAIRSFYGRGPAIVWGARTLDGNSLDYRYIPIRRTLIMIEQSVANAAFRMVFAPNDSITWSSIQGMISNFLNSLWQAGALQGAVADDAYSVEVGLGKTMSGLDILNGIMRVSVKVAIVHPAEFIIITYEQKMATS